MIDDGDGGYRAALDAAALRDRSDRGRLRISGRAPGRMLDGIVTCSLPPRDIVGGHGMEGAPAPGDAVRRGRAAYGAVLTPKGRMVTDLRILRWDDPTPAAGASPGKGAEGGAGLDASTPPAGSGLMRGPAAAPGGEGGDEAFLLDLPPAGTGPLGDHFTRFLPPRFATAEEVERATAMLTFVGPETPELLALHALGLRVDGAELRAMEDGDVIGVRMGDGWLRVVRTGEVAAPAFDVVGERSAVHALARTAESADVPPLTAKVWETLRIERGRPAFGIDMDAGTIPVEAGIGPRAIDHGKGCYTGQEVIVRIRDRGHVNRHLRGLRFEGLPPAPGTSLFAPEIRGERSTGRVTSALRSPRMGAIGLGYVRREVEPGSHVRVGAIDGPEAEVHALDDEGWGPGRSR